MLGYGKLTAFLKPINDELIGIIESGKWAEWTRTWSEDESFFNARNIFSGTVYKGSNMVISAYWCRKREYRNNIWATEAQLKRAGYYIKPSDLPYRGAISLFSPNIKVWKDEETGESHTKLVGMKAFTVFNVCSLHVGATPHAEMSVEELIALHTRNKTIKNKNNPIKEAECFLQTYIEKENIGLKVGKPSYNPSEDVIRIPELQDFTSSEAYYAALAHEVAHSTGHTSRLNRLEKTPYGSPAYAYEELVAELAAVYICASLGISHSLENHASYLGGWLKGLEQDVGYFMKAANAAQKVLEYIQDGVTSSKELVTA